MMTWSRCQPSSMARWTSAYCRSVDSRLCSTCAVLDCRTEMIAARCVWVGLTLPGSLMAWLLGGTSHGGFGDQAREDFDHEGALFVVQRIPQAGLGTESIQK